MVLLAKEIEAITNSLKDITYSANSLTPKISVILPVYNAEKYISKCLLSLIKQTEEEIEIIVVDDGSTDDTEKIVSMFANCDVRIIYIKQEHNLQGAARNNGISVAKGEYIGFVDADDWVDENYFEKLYLAAKKYDSEIALASNVRIGNGKTKKRLNINQEVYITDLQEKFDICKQWKDCCPTNKIYKTDFIKKYNILFSEGAYCEDKIFTTKAVYYSNGIVTVPNVYYYYFRNPNSTVNSKLKEKEHKNDKNKARLEVLKFLKDNNVQIRDKDFWAITEQKRIMGIPIYTKKESLYTICYYIFSFIKYKEEKI